MHKIRDFEGEKYSNYDRDKINVFFAYMYIRKLPVPVSLIYVLFVCLSVCLSICLCVPVVGWTVRITRRCLQGL